MVIQQYQDPSINRMLKFGFWYQAHKVLFYKILVGILIGINAIFWIWTFYGVSKIISSSKNDKALYSEITMQRSNVEALHKARAPKPLIINNVFAVPSISESSATPTKVGRADIVAYVENPNPDWLMDVTYSFSWSDGVTVSETTPVLPGQTTALAVLGATVSQLPTDIDIETSINWLRFTDQNKLDRAQHIRDTLKVIDTDIFSRSGVTDISITLHNTSKFNLVGTRFLLVLERISGQALASSIVNIDEVMSGKTINIDQRWLRSLSRSSQIVLYPLSNYLDEDVFRLPESGNIRF
jgi:hypothetical protein